MADYDQIMQALRNAHAAGDTAAAQRLAQMARAARQTSEAAGRIAAAKAGTLTVSPESAASAAAADEVAMAQMQPQTSVVGDIAAAVPSGFSRGVTGLLDLPGMLFSGGANLAASGLERAGIVSPDVAEGMRSSLAFGPMGTGSTARESASIVTGGASEYQPQTVPGQFAGTVSEFLPGALIGGTSGMLPRALQYGVVPGVASEAAGQAAEAGGFGETGQAIARAVGAIGAPLAVNAANRAARAAISPYGGADPERLRLAQVLDDYGVPITAGQRVGAETLRRQEGMTGAGQRIAGEQAEEFTSAVLRTAGIDAKRATADVLDEASTRIGGVFDDVVRGIDVTPDQSVLVKMSNALDEYRQLAPRDTAPPIFENINMRLVDAFRAGVPIPANTIKTWRSTVSKLTRSASAAERAAAIEAVEALDDALEQALIAAGRADDVARLTTARGQYRNLLAIEKAASGAGENAAAGILSPSAVRNAVVVQGRGAYATGRRGEIADLARAGEAIMKPLPRPGTAGELSALGVPTGIGVSAGAALGSSIGGAPGAAIGGLTGALLPPAYRALRTTPAGQSWLANQAVQPGGPIVTRDIMRTIPGLLAQ